MSKGLETLQDLRYDVSMSQDINYKIANKECDIIEKDLEKLEKLEKVVEIIKRKRLSIVYFVYEIRADKNERNYEDYKYWAMNKVKSKDDLLTEEEYLLLKEVLECN